ncbi:hypothetical protein PMAYCL1PPCAC_00772, partial [Pristionchus mayeri]
VDTDGLTHQQRLIRLKHLHERGVFGNHPSVQLLSESWTAGIFAIMEFVRRGPGDECFEDALAVFREKWRACRRNDEKRLTVLRERGYDICEAIDHLFGAFANLNAKKEGAKNGYAVNSAPSMRNPHGYQVKTSTSNKPSRSYASDGHQKQTQQHLFETIPPDEIKQDIDEEEQPLFSNDVEEDIKKEVDEDDAQLSGEQAPPVEIKEEIKDFE